MKEFSQIFAMGGDQAQQARKSRRNSAFCVEQVNLPDVAISLNSRIRRVVGIETVEEFNGKRNASRVGGFPARPD
ncbi:MAG: hypothetical protein RIK87_25890 [Fuerstiella sp.]